MQILLLSRRLLLLRDDPLLQQMPRRCGKTKTHNKTCQVSGWPDLDIVGQWTVSVEDGSPTYWRGVCSRMCNLQKYTILLMSQLWKYLLHLYFLVGKQFSTIGKRYRISLKKKVVTGQVRMLPKRIFRYFLLAVGCVCTFCVNSYDMFCKRI